MRQRVADLEKLEIESQKTEESLEDKTHALRGRVKELNCLYAFSSLIQKPNISLPEIYQGVVDLIPPGWQYPEMTCARSSRRSGFQDDQLFRNRLEAGSSV
jgi:hypothetical protein